MGSPEAAPPLLGPTSSFLGGPASSQHILLWASVAGALTITDPTLWPRTNVRPRHLSCFPVHHLLSSRTGEGPAL